MDLKIFAKWCSYHWGLNVLRDYWSRKSASMSHWFLVLTVLHFSGWSLLQTSQSPHLWRAWTPWTGIRMSCWRYCWLLRLSWRRRYNSWPTWWPWWDVLGSEAPIPAVRRHTTRWRCHWAGSEVCQEHNRMSDIMWYITSIRQLELRIPILPSNL